MFLKDILSILIPLYKEITSIKKIEITIPKIMNRFLTIIDVILVFFIIICFYMTLVVNTKRVIYIPKGSTNYIVTYLDKNNYDMNIFDKITIKLLGYPQSGWIDLKTTQMTKIEFLYRVTTSKAALRKVTLIPGETYYFFLQNLSSTLNISVRRLFDIYAQKAYKLDGNIIADTYYLPIGMNEEQLMEHLLQITNEKYKKISLKIFGLYNKKKWYKYVTIASIIQKESASKEEMPLISSVIHNRINKGMKLQMDGTLNYGKNSHKKITPQMIRNDHSQYNTYKHKGIPNDPICAIEFEAIRSAIFPAKTHYLYFMKTPKGDKHNFSSSYKNHIINIKNVQRYHRSKKKKHILSKTIKKAKKNYQTIEKSVFKRDLKELWK